MKNRFTAFLLASAAIMAYGCTSSEGGEQAELEIPALEIPADPSEECTDFRHRLVLVQHTGTMCPNCPGMTTILKKIASEPEYGGLYNHVAAHSYNESGDAAYSSAANNLSNLFCSGNYPEATFNLTTGNARANESQIKEKLNALSKEYAPVGIAADVKASDNAVGAAIQVKAAEKGNYRVAAWLLEDGIYSRQDGATDEWQHTHNNALRAMAGKSETGIYGEVVGELEAGETAEKTLVMAREDNWNINNCKVLILVTRKDSNDNYDVVNSVICKVGGKVQYDYR